ncbi:MAG: flagellar basal body rod protein FlgB [Phycisphaerae bacterium]|nr:flagellar basal body rod protein FlgB [Phycisphaerae bacterium]
MIDGLFNSGALPSLERTIQFAARRQEIIAHNIANLSTPNYQTQDVSVADFQHSLGDAIDQRRKNPGSTRGDFNFQGNREVQVTPTGLRLNPSSGSDNILFHDRNNRDLERTMQAMVENLTMFRVATDLMKSQMDSLNTAIRERL